MSTDASWHDRVTASIGGAEQYGKGILPNPWFLKMAVHNRRYDQAATIENITNKIEALSEPRFHTGSETSELIESLITMISAKNILELGTHTGRTTLHMLRAIVGIEGARVTSIDARPTHDREFFDQPEIAKHFRHITGWTPDVLSQLKGEVFNFVFVDSDHDITHTQREVEALMAITEPGSMLAFHDIPLWRTPSIREEPPVRTWLRSKIQDGTFDGLMLPSPRQLDCIEEYNDPNYPIACSPGLAVLIRK